MPDIRTIPELETGAICRGGWKTLMPLLMGLLLFGGGGIFALGQVLDGSRDTGALLAGGAGGACVIAILYLGVNWLKSRNAPYVPGKSFSNYRSSDAKIRKAYKLGMWLGVAMTVFSLLAAVIWRHQASAYGFAGGIGLAIYGYRGRISKQVHDDVDPVAVDTLRRAGLITRERVLAAYQNFNSSERQVSQRGDTVFGVLDDGILILFADDSGWKQARRKFADISKIGLYTHGEDMKIYLLMCFNDGAQYTVVLDPARLSTEPLSFLRLFLQTLDQAYAIPGAVPAGRRRRIVNEPEAATATDVVMEANVVPDVPPEVAQGLPDRWLELSPSVLAGLQTAPAVESGRSLEL